MSPETALYLGKAHTTLAEADIMLGAKLFEPAARSAYLAAFHATQALISERMDKSVKTHKGVQTLFQQITKDDPALPAEFRRFLSATYDMKMTADYEVEPAKKISEAKAARAVALAHRFVAHFTKELGD